MHPEAAREEHYDGLPRAERELERRVGGTLQRLGRGANTGWGGKGESEELKSVGVSGLGMNDGGSQS